MVKVYELETKRLRLRQWKEADKQSFAQLNANARVMAFFPQPLSRIESDALAERIISAFNQRGWGWWAVEVKSKHDFIGHDFIGFVGISVPAAALPFQPCVEIGWRLGFPYWGKGYATEAAQAALAFGFETLKLEKIVSFTATINKRSEAVMQKLGMNRVSKTFMHPSIPAGSKLGEHCLYELSMADWQANRQHSKSC